MSTALVIGAGPAGLMAADALLSAGVPTALIDAKPSFGRKFLMAGKSGLNLTRIEPLDRFKSAYAKAAPVLGPMLDALGPEEVRAWAEGLGQPCFTGSTGRLFPVAMKASPLLRAWLARLDSLGLTRHSLWRWTGWQHGALTFDTPDGPQRLTPSVTILALGGASWARLGSDGAWGALFDAEGLPRRAFAPSNSGLRIDWSAHMTPHFGRPLKNVTFHAGPARNRGEAVISARGLEGGGLYALTPALRDGQPLTLDLLPDLDHATATRRLTGQGRQSLTNRLRRALKLTDATRALVQEMARPLPQDPAALAATLKALPIRHAGLRPMDEAISTAGGVPFDALDDGLMLKAKPGTFCAGEMLDWEAPTGGYLITACLATGLQAGRRAAEWLRTRAD